MVTSRTGRPRGRPQKSFLHDPDRFAIALALAFKTLGNSENTAFRAVAAMVAGSEVATKEMAPRRKRGRGAVPGGIMVTYERAAQKGGATGSLLGRATSLRQKAARSGRDPEAMAWLLETQAAFALALRMATSVQRCAEELLKIGERVVDGTVAEDQLLIVLSAELPDLFTNDPAQV